MVEAVPTKPFSLGEISESVNILKSLQKRRNSLNEKLKFQNLGLLSLPSFPSLGGEQFFDSRKDELRDLIDEENYEEINESSNSKYVLDKLANPHNRFATLMRSIRERRGKKVEIRVPVFKDVNTEEGKTELLLDAMHFGMG